MPEQCIQDLNKKNSKKLLFFLLCFDVFYAILLLGKEVIMTEVLVLYLLCLVFAPKKARRIEKEVQNRMKRFLCFVRRKKGKKKQK